MILTLIATQDGAVVNVTVEPIHVFVHAGLAQVNVDVRVLVAMEAHVKVQLL